MREELISLRLSPHPFLLHRTLILPYVGGNLMNPGAEAEKLGLPTNPTASCHYFLPPALTQPVLTACFSCDAGAMSQLPDIPLRHFFNSHWNTS